MNRSTYGTKLTLLITGLCAVVLLVFGAVMYAMVRDIIETEIGVNAQGVAAAVSLLVMNDVEAYQQFMRDKDVESPYYLKMQASLEAIKREGDLEYIYTESQISDLTVEFMLSSERPGQRNYIKPGSYGVNDDDRRFVYDHQIAVRTKAQEHPVWGRMIAAYAPIFDREDHLLGLVGVNIDSARLDDKMNAVFAAMMGTLAFTVCVLVIFLLRFAHVILEPVIKDKLTGIYNKRFLDQFLQRAVRGAARGGELAVLMMDLDFFKKVNDTYGHAFGDKVLAFFAARAKELLRRGDCLARYGGEEFVAVLPGVTLKEAMVVAERIRRVVENAPIPNDEKDCEVKVTVSIGVAYLNSETISAAALVDRADQALYAAKRTRNAVCAYQPKES